MRIGSWVLTGCCLIAMSASCGSGDSGGTGGNGAGGSGGGSDVCSRLHARFTSCGFVRFAPLFYCREPGSDYIRCIDECFLSLACTEVTTVLCSTTTSAIYEQCTDQCPDNGYTCADGANVQGERCDGVPDCGDGSDEAGCPTFRCDNGNSVSAAKQCNVTQDCSDGSDEKGCASIADMDKAQDQDCAALGS
ncbi:MAG: LDL receptor domain-containing protein [Polyangiaceae bacterium]